MLEQAYGSVSIAEKMPFTEENLREIIEKYSAEGGQTCEITSDGNAMTVLCQYVSPFELVNRIEMTLGKSPAGYKFLDGKLIIPL